MAEKVGHHFTDASTSLIYASQSYANEIARSKDEHRAMRWATDFLIPDIELAVALDDFGCRSCYELAEHFNVTIPFMMAKLTYLKQCFRKNGLRVKGKQLFTLQHVACRW